jgi:hypothetical protein
MVIELAAAAIVGLVLSGSCVSIGGAAGRGGGAAFERAGSAGGASDREGSEIWMSPGTRSSLAAAGVGAALAGSVVGFGASISTGAGIGVTISSGGVEVAVAGWTGGGLGLGAGGGAAAASSGSASSQSLGTSSTTFGRATRAAIGAGSGGTPGTRSWCAGGAVGTGGGVGRCGAAGGEVVATGDGLGERSSFAAGAGAAGRFGTGCPGRGGILDFAELPAGRTDAFGALGLQIDVAIGLPAGLAPTMLVLAAVAAGATGGAVDFAAVVG